MLSCPSAQTYDRPVTCFGPSLCCGSDVKSQAQQDIKCQMTSGQTRRAMSPFFTAIQKQTSNAMD